MSKRFLFLLPFAFSVVCVFFSCSRDLNRQEISLNGEWRFYADSNSLGELNSFGEKGIPENLSRPVIVPHAWNAEKGLESYWGKSWYQREIQVPANQLNKTTRLKFDAVYHDAVIWVNGKIAGSHIGSGYNRFYIEISSLLKSGKNILTVMVDNSPSRNNIPFLKSFDWANDGGIFRSVNEVITEKQAIRDIHVNAIPKEKTGFASIAVNFIDISAIDKSKLRINATITEENQSSRNEIFNGELKGQFIGESFVCNLTLNNIEPWHFDDPNLYKIDIQLIIDDVRRDALSTIFGFRSIRVTNGRYFLNDEPMRLMGVEWMPGSNLMRGMAETREDIEKNLTLMKNANCVFTRFHWQQDEYVFDWCDRNGILVQEEIPLWGGATVLNDTLLNLGMKHLDEMISSHFNHPSIICWGVGNELLSHDSLNYVNIKKLSEHARSLDSSRLINYVSNSLHWGFPGEGQGEGDATSGSDMMMFNEYFSTWYGQSLDVISPMLDKIDSAYKDKPLTISEWGLCEPVHLGGDERRCKEMVRQLEIYGSKPFIAGAIYFCLNDYRTHIGEDFTYNYPQRVHGVCDLNLNKKPSYDTLKIISSPIIVKNIIYKGDTTYVTITGKKGVPEYIVRDYYLASGNQRVLINALKPGDDATYGIKTKKEGIRIFRPTGFEVLNLPGK